MDDSLHIEDWKQYVKDNYNNEEKEFLKDIIAKINECKNLADVRVLFNDILSRGFVFQSFANRNVFYCISGIHLHEKNLISFETLQYALEKQKIGVMEITKKQEQMTEQKAHEIAKEAFNHLKEKYNQMDKIELMMSITQKLASHPLFYKVNARQILTKRDYETLSDCVQLLQKKTNTKKDLVYVNIFLSYIVDKYVNKR